MTRLWVSAAVVFCACGADRVIYADEGPDGNLTAALEPSDEDPADREASDLACASPPEGSVIMPGLRSGWAVDQGGRTLLQFSNHAMACGVPVEDAFGRANACPELWAFEIAIDDALLVPADVVLSAQQVATLVQLQRGATGEGCSRDEIHSSTLGFGGTLRLHAVDDDCIVGEFIDLTFPTDDLTGLSGVFAAERC